jgi:hypothetical protein
VYFAWSADDLLLLCGWLSGRPYMPNYLPIFKKSALLFVSASMWGGWHHVEVHSAWWWRARMEAQGFVYSHSLTEISRKQAFNDWAAQPDPHKTSMGQHIRLNLLVFINPKVASLPEHAHLFGGNGCYAGGGAALGNEDGGVACKDVDALPPAFQPLINCHREKKDKEVRNAIWTCEKNPDATAN